MWHLIIISFFILEFSHQFFHKDIYPIESNKGTILYSLKEEGLVCIILPDDRLMISPKYNKINIKKGLFINTGVKTKGIILKQGHYDNLQFNFNN